MNKKEEIEKKISQIHHNLHNAEKCRQTILHQINIIKEACMRKEISFDEYSINLSQKIDNLSLTEWAEYYDNYINLCAGEINKIESEMPVWKKLFS